jgi:hypothetical protein
VPALHTPKTLSPIPCSFFLEQSFPKANLGVRSQSTAPQESEFPHPLAYSNGHHQGRQRAVNGESPG